MQAITLHKLLCKTLCMIFLGMQNFAEGLANPGGFSTLLTSHRPRAFRRTGVGLTFLHVFSCFFACKKTHENLDLKKNCFGATFCDFQPVRRRFSSILGPKTAPRRVLFRCFFENVDFLKIVLPLWWEHSFQGSDPPKISPETDSERQRREKT